MIEKRLLINAAVLLCVTAPAYAQSIDSLNGKFGFNWLNRPDREKCVKIDDRLLAEFKSTRYSCNLKPTSRTELGVIPKVCTELKGAKKKEYLIFDSYRACDAERRGQASNG